MQCRFKNKLTYGMSDKTVEKLRFMWPNVTKIKKENSWKDTF